MIQTILPIHAKGIFFNQIREFFLFDLCYGEYPFITFSENPIKMTEFYSSFPFYVFPNEHQRIFSFGPSRVFLFPSNHSTHSSLKFRPNTLLNNVKFEPWKSSTIIFSKNIPFYSQTFVYKFDIISNIKRSIGVVNIINLRLSLFEIKSKNPLLESSFRVVMLLNLQSTFTETFVGSATIYIVEFKNGSIYQFEKEEVEIKETRIDLAKAEWINKMNSNPDFFSSSLKEFNFFQVLSPQTLIIKVRDKYY